MEGKIEWKIRSNDEVLCSMIQHSWDMEKNYEITYGRIESNELEAICINPIDWVLDILGVPVDNTADDDLAVIETSNMIGEWAECGTCRDYWYNYKDEHPDAKPIDFINEVKISVNEAKQSPYYPK